MKNKIIINILFLFLSFFIKNNIYANEFTFDVTDIKILDNGNVIHANLGVAKSINNKIQIEADKFIYNKLLSTLEAKGNATAKSLEQDIYIEADKFIYDEKISILNARGDVEIQDLKKKVTFQSKEIFYNTESKIIRSNTESTIRDHLGNTFVVKSFVYTLNDGLVKINKAKVKDIEKNLVHLEKAYINLNSNKLIGKDISIDFNNKSFQNDNEPRLKGNTVVTDGDETLVTKGVFTTCKKNDNCPPWQLSAQEVKHDKKKKTIYYKNAWLKLYDKPVFYFPKFFHPDPSVKRQSGFLMPTFEDSSTLGASLNVPYYLVIANNKDLTLKPRFYSEEKLLLQTEYREVNAKSNHILDFSFVTKKGSTSKSHFFSKTAKKLNFDNFDESELNFQIQQTSDDTYLKTYKLKSPIISETGQLTSSLEVSAYRDDLSLNTDFYVYENLSKEDSDRYEFVYPSFTILKELDTDDKFNGNFSINSSGYLKNYDTNIFEKVLVNDLIYNSNAKITDKGFKNSYNFLFKNINTEGKNSSKYNNDKDYKIGSLIEFNSSYPLKKEGDSFDKMFKPILSLKFSPNTSKNIKDANRRIDINNIYSFNRIGFNDTLEGGASITYGTEFSKTNKSDKEVFGLKIANILRVEEEKKLPATSGMGNKTSDIIGNLNYDPNDLFRFNYDFSIDENLKDTNYQLINSEFKINNFVTTFEYLNENKTGINNSYLSNKTTYKINDSNNLILEARENKKTNATEFYNLIYQYRNDCLIAAIEYNKDYYTDRDLKPEENIFFKLTIIPFGETSSPNLK